MNKLLLEIIEDGMEKSKGMVFMGVPLDSMGHDSLKVVIGHISHIAQGSSDQHRKDLDTLR